ncbi:MAG: TonB-dependent receptor domain-containing protein [Bacteroidales bacterium]
MRISLLTFLLILTCFSTFSQATLRGKISDENGESVVGAAIFLKSTPTVGTISDLDGNYSLKVPSDSEITVVISYVSYQTTEEKALLEQGEVKILNFTMLPATMELEDVVIVARAKRENDSYMRMKKINSPVAFDYISKETIKKTGDSHIDDAVKRVTGVSMVSGYITVRGLADRYIRTTINGFRIPTLNPLSNNIKLDMFPTSLVDNIVINKTLSPDLPADWAGSYLSIETKDYPDRLMVYVKSSLGFNSQSSMTDVLSTQRSETDWLGFDNGFRDVRTYGPEDFPYYTIYTSPYHEFSALGLEDYLENHGITIDNLPQPYNIDQYAFIDNIYYRMGLVELDLLAPGYIQDENKVKEAIDNYFNYPEMKPGAHMQVNEEAIKYGSSLPGNWLTNDRENYIDFSQDIAFGNQVELFGKPLGFVAGLRYSTSMRYDPNTIKEIGIFSQSEANLGEFVPVINYTRERSTETNQWSAMLNAAYKISPNHSISMLIMPNFTGVNSANTDSGYNDYAYANYGLLEEFSHQQYYEERKQIIYQINSRHYFPGPRLRIEFGAGYTDGEGNTPDFKTLKYGKVEEGYAFRQYFYPVRNYRYLDEDILDAHLSFEIPVFEKPGLARKLKLGGSFFSNDRENRQYSYEMAGNFNRVSNFQNITELREFLDPSTFKQYNYTTNSVYHYYVPYFYATDYSIGYSRISSAYAMLDYTLLSRLRLTGGLRVEYTDIYTDQGDLFNTGVPANDPLREVELPGFSRQIFANSAFLEETNYLPSFNLVYKLANTNNIGMNARFSYSQSVGRPSIREISAYYDFNYDVSNWILGNPDLKMVYINNYDFRLETFFKSGDNISLSLFYKEFANHIELGNENNAFSWRNAPGMSEALGIEIEGRKSFLKNFEIMGNVTLIESRAIINEVINGISSDTLIRSMYGQAPYILNGIMSYSSEKIGISASLSYNVQGPKLVFVTITQEQPDVYELPRHLLDFKLSKSLGKHFNIELKIRDILNARVVWAYDYENYRYEYEGYNYGTSYTLGISYNL